MAQFADITITRTGLDMIAKSQTGDKLIFTGIKIGDGQIGAQSIPDMTNLINFKQDVPINSVTAKENGHAEIIGIIDNENLDVGFFVREIGIYAKINEGGTPALYGYANAGNLASYMSDKSIPMDAIKFKIDIVVGNADNVSFISDKSIVYVTQENLDAHNESEDSHPDIRQKITNDIAAHNMNASAHDNLLRVTSMETTGGELKYITQDGEKHSAGYVSLNILQRNKKYEVGDIAYSASLPSWAYLECTTAGTTGETEPDFSNITTGGVHDGTAGFVVMDMRIMALVDIVYPVGVVIGVDNDDTPAFTAYGTWEKIAADRFLMGGGGVHDVGSDVEAGLPDVTGTFTAFRQPSGSGCFASKGSTTTAAVGYDTSYKDAQPMTMQLSRGNSIYGNSDTVQPPAHVVQFWKRVK